MSLPEFKLLRPRTLDEAVALLSKHAANGASRDGAPIRPRPESGGIEVLAGGTDLVPSLNQKIYAPEYVLDIRRIRDLHGIREQPDGSLTIGALTTLTEIEQSKLVQGRYRVLSEAARTVASPVIRNQATLGGNVCLDTRCLWYNQSLLWRKSCGFCIKKDGNLCHVAPGGDMCWAAFSGDTPAALLCLDAGLEIAGPAGIERVPIGDFYTGLGEARMKLRRDQIVARVLLPAASAGWRGVYRKLRVRGSIDYPLAGVALAIKANGHIESAKLALTAVNPAPTLVKGIDRVLVGKSPAEITEDVAAEIGELAARAARPLTTSALTPEYRKEMVRVFAKRALLEALRS